ncbi:MAG: tRNA 2-thiocytidine biosynthesis TtcA family protein [Defluviitaleaceae bacterium]|nr:tRNA 2-thiocytidine biosynthesis TtcA family protein [Defluviitaleaceae bacterium]
MKSLTKIEQIERSISKKFRPTIWRPFIEGIKRYDLISKGDRIAVCISGGKDSMLLAKLMQALRRFSDFPFDLKFLVMDPGYNEINRQKTIANAATLEIPVEIFQSNIFETVQKTDRSPCYLCARMRRGFLYARAQELGCNKIALGHHFSDVIETTLMNIFYNSEIGTMMPKLTSKNFPEMELIRPMYCVHEEAIIAWARYNDLQFIRCACPLSEACNIFDVSGGGSRRQEVKALLKQLRRDNKDVEMSIFTSLHRVNLDTVLGTIQKECGGAAQSPPLEKLLRMDGDEDE